MDDIFRKSPVEGEQTLPEITSGETRVMAPVEGAPAQPAGRRRRTERNRASYDEAPAALPEMEDAAAAPQAEEAVQPQEQPPAAPAETTRQAPVSREASPAAQGEGSTTAVPRFQTRYNPPVPGSIPSQGVPRPAALNQQGQRRPVFMAGAGEARRPVQAEGYVSARPLGSGRTNAQEQPQRAPGRVPAQAAKRQTGSVPTLDDGDDYEVEGKRSPLLPIIIIVLLVIAALVLGLLLIPNDMEGPLGDIKRSVTGIFGGSQSSEPAQVLGFTGEPNKDTAPYQITFQVITNNAVSDVRIVNERGETMLTTPISDPTPNSIGMLHMLSMTLTEEYEGYIYLQIHDGENWLETEYKQQLTIGADMKLKISETSSTTLTAGSTAAATASTPLTAGSTKEPTVSPAVEEKDDVQGLPAPVVTQTPDGADASLMGEAAPFATLTPSPVVTPTPTMALTPTPTIPAAALPTVTATPEPTAEPTAVPTPTPTATPVPTPAPTVKLEAAAAEGASPSLVANQKIYKGTRRVDSYQRDEESIINMPAGDEYLTMPFGVTTFRGNAFRMNAAVGYVAAPTAMETAWSVEGGGLQLKAGWRYGFGVYSQPAIVKWTREVRELMALNEGYREKGSLKEVIIAGQDGKVYFLDLSDGSVTREPIDIGYALRGAPSVNTLGYPVITFGQWSNKLASKTAKSMGLYYYNLANNKQLRLVNTLDDHAHNPVGAMDTSALFDRNSNTLIAIGTNGVLYTEKMSLYLAVGSQGNEFTFKEVEEQASLVSYTKEQKNKTSQAAVESSLAMYGSYAFYADMGGILRCVDTTTMTTIWAVNTGDAVRASIALDLDPETNTLWLYTANTITNRSKNGDVTIRRYNAMTGEEDWNLPVNSIRKFKGQADATGKDITAGAVASPIIGQHELNGLVYFTLSSVSANGAEALGREGKQLPSVLVAMDKATGDVAWTHAMDAYSYSSPVAVYSEAGEGWVIQCCSNGTIYLLDGLTGTMINTLQVAGTIEGSPAVYGNMMVFGTTGKDKSFIYGVRIK